MWEGVCEFPGGGVGGGMRLCVLAVVVVAVVGMAVCVLLPARLVSVFVSACVPPRLGQNHVSEYGVHWNFFLTFGIVSAVASFAPWPHRFDAPVGAALALGALSLGVGCLCVCLTLCTCSACACVSSLCCVCSLCVCVIVCVCGCVLACLHLYAFA